MTEIPILQKKRTYKVPGKSGYHSFFKVTKWNFSKFVAFLIDTNNDDANPRPAVNACSLVLTNPVHMNLQNEKVQKETTWNKNGI
jgi:hypothetical protein